MNPAIQNSSLADYYFGILKDLNVNSKLDLISKLSQSLKQEREERIYISAIAFRCLQNRGDS